LLFLANGLRAVVVLIIGLVGVRAVPEFFLLLAFVLTLSCTRIVLATKSAALPATLEESSLVEANAVSQLGGALFQLAGGGAAFIAAAVIDVRPIAIVGALVYAGGAAFALAVRHAEERRTVRSFSAELARIWRSIVEGFKEVAARPKAGASITTYFWLRLLWSFTIVGIGFVARRLLNANEVTFLVLTGGAGAIGAAIGFLLAGKLHARVASTAKLVVGAAAVAGTAVLVFGGLKLNIALAVLTFFLSFGFFLAKISLDTMVQEALGDDFRGRAFALYDIAYNVGWVLAAAIWKLTFDPASLNIVIAAMGAVFLLGLALIALWFKRAGLLAVPATTERAAAVR